MPAGVWLLRLLVTSGSVMHETPNCNKRKVDGSLPGHLRLMVELGKGVGREQPGVWGWCQERKQWSPAETRREGTPVCFSSTKIEIDLRTAFQSTKGKSGGITANTSICLFASRVSLSIRIFKRWLGDNGGKENTDRRGFESHHLSTEQGTRICFLRRGSKEGFASSEKWLLLPKTVGKLLILSKIPRVALKPYRYFLNLQKALDN